MKCIYAQLPANSNRLSLSLPLLFDSAENIVDGEHDARCDHPREDHRVAPFPEVDPPHENVKPRHSRCGLCVYMRWECECMCVRVCVMSVRVRILSRVMALLADIHKYCPPSTRAEVCECECLCVRVCLCACACSQFVTCEGPSGGNKHMLPPTDARRRRLLLPLPKALTNTRTSPPCPCPRPRSRTT